MPGTRKIKVTLSLTRSTTWGHAGGRGSKERKRGAQRPEPSRPPPRPVGSRSWPKKGPVPREALTGPGEARAPRGDGGCALA